MKILAMDPSGDFTRGKGTTGWCIAQLEKNEIQIIAVGSIRAESCDTKLEYWNKHLDVLDLYKVDEIVVEDFILYPQKAKAQFHSPLETPRLLGLLEVHIAKVLNKPMHLQKATQVKTKYDDRALLREGVIQQQGNRYYAGGVMTDRHIRDSIRHAVRFLDKRKEHYKCT